MKSYAAWTKSGGGRGGRAGGGGCSGETAREAGRLLDCCARLDGLALEEELLDGVRLRGRD